MGKKILEDSNKKYIEFDDYNVRSYNYLKEVLYNDSIEKRYLFIDADNAIKDESKSVFVDHVHFGDRGNKLISDYLYKIIVKIIH